MMVVSNNVVRIGRNGTIHKLIVIRIDCNQIKVIEWSYQFNKRTVQYGFHHIFRRFIVGKSLRGSKLPIEKIYRLVGKLYLVATSIVLGWR